MEQKFLYHFDSQTGIVYKNYYGKITIDDIENSWIYAFEQNLFPPNTIGFILDYREASFEISIEEYIKIPLFYTQHLDVFGGKKIAIVTDNPKDVVIPVLVQKKDKGYASQPFSTVEAAIYWVLH
ncbi:MAG: hypothetical protein ACOCWB_07445 [Bacteroidota bacterium]